MGHIDDETALLAEYKDGSEWLVLTLSRGDPAKHVGISIEMPTPASRWAVPAQLVAAAYAGDTAFANLIALHTAPGSGPFPSTSGTAFWSGLSATQKALVRDHVLWFAGRRPPI